MDVANHSYFLITRKDLFPFSSGLCERVAILQFFEMSKVFLHLYSRLLVVRIRPVPTCQKYVIGFTNARNLSYSKLLAAGESKLLCTFNILGLKLFQECPHVSRHFIYMHEQLKIVLNCPAHTYVPLPGKLPRVFVLLPGYPALPAAITLRNWFYTFLNGQLLYYRPQLKNIDNNQPQSQRRKTKLSLGFRPLAFFQNLHSTSATTSSVHKSERLGETRGRNSRQGLHLFLWD